MAEKLEIKCKCGMTTHIVLVDGIWRYDVELYGNGEPCKGKCFNCGAKLQHEEFAEPVETVDTGTDQEPPVKDTEIDLNKLSAKQLRKFAEEHNIEIPSYIKKVDDLRSFIADAVSGTGS